MLQIINGMHSFVSQTDGGITFDQAAGEYDKPSCLTDLQQFLKTSTVDAIHKASTLLGL
jgi:hypothetical protein